MEDQEGTIAGLLPADPVSIGPFRLLGRLGAGGMGQVYLGRSAAGESVAVKVIRPELAGERGFRARFAREVAAARRVSGTFTALLVDADVDGPVPWLATAYVAGPSLADAVAEAGPLPAGTLRSLAVGLAAGLEAIHATGLVHRDLKPSNVLLASDGPRVIDFGISRAVEASMLTETGMIMGSPGFMSPEQARGLVVGPPSDVFSLGAVLAFAATGTGPFGAGAVASLLYRVVNEEPEIAGVPGELGALIARCLAKDPAERPTPAALLAELGSGEIAPGWLPESVTATLPRYAPTSAPAPPTVPASAEYRPTVVTAAAAAVVPKEPALAGTRQLPARGARGAGRRRLALAFGATAVAAAVIVAAVLILDSPGQRQLAGGGPTPTPSALRTSPTPSALRTSPTPSGPGTATSGLSDDYQPPVIPFTIAAMGAGGVTAAIESDGDLVVAYAIKSGAGKTVVCVLDPGKTKCSHTVTLSPPNGNDMFGLPAVFVPSANHVVVLMGDCCDSNPAGSDLLYTSTDGGAVFGAPVRVGTLGVDAAALVGNQIVFSEGDNSNRAQAESIPVDATGPPSSIASVTGNEPYDIGVGSYQGGALIASDHQVNGVYTTYVSYAPAGENFNATGSYHNVGSFPHEQLMAISGDALLTQEASPTGTGVLNLRLFNGTSFGAAHVVPNSGGGGPGWFTVDQDPSGRVHVFTEGAFSNYSYHLYEQSTSTGVNWSAPVDLGNAIESTTFGVALGAAGTGLVVGTDDNEPVWGYPVRAG